MIYPYRCVCGNDFDVIKSMKDMDEPEVCDDCGQIAQRYIARVNHFQIHDWTETYNPAFGCVVKNKAHQRELLRQFADQGKFFEEVGNEPVDNLHKYFDDKREENRKQRWRDADNGIEEIL